MTLRSTIAPGLGGAVCLCLAIAATMAQQTEGRKAYTIHRVIGDDLSPNREPVTSKSQTAGPPQVSQAVPFDGDPRLTIAPSPQSVVVSEATDAFRNETTVTQEQDPDTLLFGGTAGPISGICCRNVIGQGCDPVVTTLDNCNGPTDRFCPNAVACPAPGDPFCPSFEGPDSPPCPFIIANDDCDDLIILSGSVCVPFNTLIATNSGVLDPPGFDTVNNDVFFGYIVKGIPPLPNNDGRLIVSTFGSEFDTSVAVYRVDTALVDIRFPADLAAVCADIAVGGGANAFGQVGGFGDDIDNRPAARVNPLTYICINDPFVGILPGDQFVIRVGSPFPGIGGPGVLNVDYLPISPAPWFGGIPGGRCCLANGDCVIVPALVDCLVLSGFFRNITDFYFGRDPAILAADPPLTEITCVGCKSLPCAPIGGACFNPIDLRQVLLAKTGTGFGTVTRLIRKKLYYAYQIPTGCGAIEIDTCGSTDAAGGGGFNTFLKVFKWNPTYPNNCLTNGEADAGDLPTLQNPVPFNTGAWLVVNGQVMINDDCRFDDQPENTAAQGATASAPCYNNLQGTETDSCLCFPVGTGEGNDPGDWILICIGQLNPERDASGVNSIDPVENPTLDPVLASLSIRCLTECFNCVLDSSGFVIDLAEPEQICTDGVMGINDGCNAILATSTGGPVINPQTTPITPALNVPFYITGNSGIFNLDGITQHEDNDWYELNLAQPAKLTWQLVQAEFTAQIAILKAGNPATSNLCNTTGFLLNTTTPCDDDTMNDLTVDVCAGKYYLMIRPRLPFKPVPCGTDSEYLCCVLVQPQKAVNCCPGDANNDGTLDGTDIQQYVDTLTHPPPAGTGRRLGGCYEQSFCQADTNLDGFLTVADAGTFVTLLLSKTPCIPKPDQCIDTDRCQLPDNAAIANGLVSSDRNPQSFDADASVPDDFRAADCFCPTASGSVTDVCWWGAYTDRDAIFQENAAGVDCITVDDFTITYYTNIFDAQVSDFCPGQVKAGPFSVVPTRVATGNIIQLAFGDVQEYRYEALHPPVPVTAGECCWISIVNNTTGRCTWRWETSPFGNGIAFQQENQNQGLNVFPTVWDCLRDRTAAGIDLAFCLNILIGSNGCDTVSTVLGQCCFVDGAGQQLCLVLTSSECTINYDGQFTSGGTCASPCPPAECVVTCQAGDFREAEGCGFDKNGGCDDDVMNPPIIDLGVLVCEDTAIPGSGVPIVICGTANTLDQAGVDSDWYSFIVVDPTGEDKITLDLEAQPDLIVELRRRLPPDTPQTDGCSELLASATSNDGDCTTVTAGSCCLPNGEYLVRVLSSLTRAVPCDESSYRITIKCVGIGPCLPSEACCFLDGTCLDADALCCENVLGGASQGAGTTCTPNPCCALQSLSYLATGSGTTGDLSNDNPDGTGGADGTEETPSFGGGWRFFPGAATFATRVTSRNIVRIRVVVLPAKAGIPIHFRSFDVDDPSADVNIDPNGNGRDNRGRLNAAFDMPVASVAPGANGYRGRLRPVGGAFAAEGAVLTVNTVLVGGQARAEVELATTFAPGDNFRVVASCNNPEVVALNETTSVATTGPITGFTGKVTDQLSIWRGLHYEEDQMATTAGDMQAGAIGAGGPVAVPGQPTQRDVPTNIAIGRLNTYQNGILRSGGLNYTVVSNTAMVVGGDTVRIQLGANLAPVGGAAVTVFEDDYTAVANGAPTTQITLPRKVNTGLMQTSTILGNNIYAAAYIEPELTQLNSFDSTAVVGTQVPGTTHMPFDDAPSLVIINPLRGTNGNETDVYWIVYLTSALQELESDDYDPNNNAIGNGQITGFAPSDAAGTGGDACLAYLEVIRDVVLNDPQTAGGVTSQLLEQRVAAHEIGHCFTLQHAAGQNVMNSVPRVLMVNATNARFTAAHISTIRQRRKSPGE